MKASIPVRDFFKKFPTDESCLVHLFNIRFGQGHECPKCLTRAKWYRIEAERAFSCGSCGHHIHPTVGTPFEDTRTSLQMWFYAIYLFTTSRHGVSGKELQRQLGVTYKTAWRIGHQIRQHMAAVDGEEKLGGSVDIAVEIDETYVGGKSLGRGHKRKLDNKTIVMGMLERDGDLMTRIVPNTKKETCPRTPTTRLRPVITSLEPKKPSITLALSSVSKKLSIDFLFAISRFSEACFSCQASVCEGDTRGQKYL